MQENEEIKNLKKYAKNMEIGFSFGKQEIQNAHLENRRKLKDSSFKKIREEKHWNAYRFKVKFKILTKFKTVYLMMYR